MNNPVCSAEAQSPGAFPTVILHLQIPLTPSINNRFFSTHPALGFSISFLKDKAHTCQWLQGGLCSKRSSLHSTCQAQIARLNLPSRKSSLLQVGFHVLTSCSGGSWGTQMGWTSPARWYSHSAKKKKNNAWETQNSCCSAGPVRSHGANLLQQLWAHSPKQFRAPLPHFKAV